MYYRPSTTTTRRRGTGDGGWGIIRWMSTTSTRCSHSVRTRHSPRPESAYPITPYSQGVPRATPFMELSLPVHYNQEPHDLVDTRVSHIVLARIAHANGLQSEPGLAAVVFGSDQMIDGVHVPAPPRSVSFRARGP
jgi:hypothetical protein